MHFGLEEVNFADRLLAAFAVSSASAESGKDFHCAAALRRFKSYNDIVESEPPQGLIYCFDDRFIGFAMLFLLPSRYCDGLKANL